MKAIRARLGRASLLLSAVGLVLVVIVPLIAAGCGGRGLDSVLPRESTFPSGRYSVARVLQCLSGKHIEWSVSAGIKSLRAEFADGGAVPQGLIGEIDIFGAGAAPTPLDKAFGGSDEPGPKINSASLVFFENEKLALKGVRRVVERYELKADMTQEQRKLSDDTVGPPPPRSAIPDLVLLAGNILVLWVYPMTHTERSNRVLGGCFAAHTRLRHVSSSK